MVVGIQKHIGEAIAKLSRNRNSLLDKVSFQHFWKFSHDRM
jgi:hypothetical protein